MFHKCAIKFIKYSPRMRGSTYGGVSGCRYANISLHMQGSTRSCAASFDHRNIPRERGGLPIIRNRGVLAAVYSPRTRGSSLVCIMAEQEWNIFPRERGGQPCVACPGAGMRTFPCICRGQPAAVLLHLTTGIFPANAGVIPRSRG